MYLSKLLIDTGGNPDRPRPGRAWLSNVYNVHRRLSMAFPAKERASADPDNLHPFNQDDLIARQFLFRVDNGISPDGSRAIILVQSELLPNWDWCFHNAPDFLVAPPECTEYHPTFTQDAVFSFRIELNPTVKSNTHRSVKPDKGEKSQGKRVSLTWDASLTPDEAIGNWFASKASSHGFAVLSTELVRMGWKHGIKPLAGSRAASQDSSKSLMKFRTALLTGTLRVTDPALFTLAYKQGIGSAKSFGFGMLSLRSVANAEQRSP